MYTAAHGGFQGTGVPLGGGAAIANLLMGEWRRAPFETVLLCPKVLGARAPSAHDLVAFSEHRYAEFCGDFEQAVTREIEERDPGRTVVLSNDISEGPDFRRLAARGFRVFTIFHVDVVAYVAAIYLNGWVSPKALAGWGNRLERWLPGLLRLIFAKQRDAVEFSKGLIVPSAAMRKILEECYPAARGKVHVIPWGVPEARDAPELPSVVAALRHEYGVPKNALCLLTLSRLSPEKGQDLLLQALARWERSGTLPRRPLWLFLCGAPAFMQGSRFLRRLEMLASRLRRIEVVFPGYVTGVRKRAFFELADIYLFPSRHESYGLTLMEALQAGRPAICLDHAGAREVMRPEFGRLVDAHNLVPALAELAADAGLRKRMGAAAREFAACHPFAPAAARLACLVAGPK